ncbi:Chloroperoxidase [Cyathus striatus]|nr:Chloroperoxidase [Cyathus striatus]
MITPIYLIQTGQVAGSFLWDLLITGANFLLPQRPLGSVVPKGHPGEGGKWPKYIAPGEGDSRCACPALNAMANHGIIPRDGRNLSFREVNDHIRDTYNIAPSFCMLLLAYAANVINKNYWTDRFDLAEVSRHNGIEHDASLTRDDTAQENDQSKPDASLVHDMLNMASGVDEVGRSVIRVSDLSKYTAQRRKEAKARDPRYSLALVHDLFSIANTAFFTTMFAGNVSDLEAFLAEERIPDGWESKVRSSQGLTVTSLNTTALAIRKGV